MTKKSKRKIDAALKAKIALEALRELGAALHTPGIEPQAGDAA